ncbi:MAG: hypothetical protein ACE5JG_01395, partial [Planctomycetota bacterium]
MNARSRWAALLLALFAASPAALAGTFETWLPENTVLYVSLDDLSGLRETYRTGPLGRLVAEEEVQAFLEGSLQKWSWWMEKAKGEFGGLSPEDALATLNGQVVLAVTGLETLEGGKVRI